MAKAAKPVQTSLFDPATTKDKIDALARQKATRGDHKPMDWGLFGESHKQLDLVDMAKQPRSDQAARDKAVAEHRKAIERIEKRHAAAVRKGAKAAAARATPMTVARASALAATPTLAVAPPVVFDPADKGITDKAGNVWRKHMNEPSAFSIDRAASPPPAAPKPKTVPKRLGGRLAAVAMLATVVSSMTQRDAKAAPSSGDTFQRTRTDPRSGKRITETVRKSK